MSSDVNFGEAPYPSPAGRRTYGKCSLKSLALNSIGRFHRKYNKNIIYL